MERAGLYAGSFDPLTNGHLDVIKQAMRLVDRLVIAVGAHPGKTPLFSAAQRVEMIRRACAPLGANIEVTTFAGLTVDAAREAKAGILIRGLRHSGDLDDEMQLAGMNAKLSPEIQTIFIPSSSETRFITATLVRQIAAMKGDVSSFVPETIAEHLRML